MSNLLTILLLAAVFTSCSKPENNYTECDAGMIEKFKEQIAVRVCQRSISAGICQRQI